MRRIPLLLAILLCPAAPGLAQVTVDLHALDALPRAAGTQERRPSLSVAPPHANAVPQPAPQSAMPPSTASAAAAPPRTAVTLPPTAPMPGPASGTAATAAALPPPAATPQAAPPPSPPAATLPTAPPAVASIAPIEQPAAPAGAPPPPAPPVSPDAATEAAATQAGLRLTFASGQTELNPGSADSIKQFAQASPNGDATTFNVLAYASGNADDPSSARRLSLARAIAVRSALMADGIPSSRIYLRALGSQPGEAPADRVDVSVLGGNAGSAARAQ